MNPPGKTFYGGGLFHAIRVTHNNTVVVTGQGVTFNDLWRKKRSPTTRNCLMRDGCHLQLQCWGYLGGRGYFLKSLKRTVGQILERVEEEGGRADFNVNRTFPGRQNPYLKSQSGKANEMPPTAGPVDFFAPGGKCVPETANISQAGR